MSSESNHAIQRSGEVPHLPPISARKDAADKRRNSPRRNKRRQGQDHAFKDSKDQSPHDQAASADLAQDNQGESQSPEPEEEHEVDYLA